MPWSTFSEFMPEHHTVTSVLHIHQKRLLVLHMTHPVPVTRSTILASYLCASVRGTCCRASIEIVGARAAAEVDPVATGLQAAPAAGPHV
jgi:hypothetical protein